MAAETTRADVATDDKPRARRDADRTRHTCDLSKLVAVSAQSAISIEYVLHPLEPAPIAVLSSSAQTELIKLDTPDAPSEVPRVGVTARAACTPFGWL